MKGMVLFIVTLLLITVPTSTYASMEQGYVHLFYRSITVYAPAVAKTENGLVGTATTITVTVQNGTGCSGKVFVETVPLTEIDMQGSARLAVSVAGSLTGIDTSKYDFFFVIKTPAPIIGGPSAGAVMTVATIAALEGWKLDNKTMMTGMIDPDGSIGPVGGIKEKIDAAHSVGAERFLIPKGQMVVYTTVTKKEISGGWIRIYTQREKVNVSKYARNKYGMEVIEVEDINDALLYFTGHRFKEQKVNKNITTENYTTSMKPLAEHLISRAERSYRNASYMFNSTKDRIPNIFPFNYREEIEKSLKDSKDSLVDSEKAYNRDLFYSSTSKSFQSLINSRFVTYACRYFTTDDEKDYLKGILDYANNLLNNSKNIAKDSDIGGMISLQCVGAAQKRVFDAEDYIDSAKKDYREGNYLNALYKLSFSIERCMSVGWWINISKEFEEKIHINESEINETVNRYLDLAKNSVTYSQIILQEMGENSHLIDEANDLLEEAEKEDGNYPAASLFTSLEAMTKANLAIETVSGVTEDRLERVKDKAAIWIGEDRQNGIEPLLAVSYYEFAETLENESIGTSIVYYRYSQMIAGALRYALNPVEKRISRFEGIPPINPIPTPLDNLERAISDMAWTIVYILIIVAVVIGMAILISGRNRFKRDFPPETW